MPLFNEVTDNYIHDCGVFKKYIAGVFLGVSDGNLIAHNRLEHLPHHAINLGSNAFGRNLVERNEIRYVCQEIWDTAAINSWMEEPISDARAGHVIRFNRIMDVIGCHTDRKGNIVTPDGAANGIYLDANTSNCFIQGNTIVRSSGYAVYVHGGQHNFIENNIIVDSTLNAEILPPANSGKIKYTGFSGQIGYYGNLRSAFLVGNRFCNNIVSYKQGPYSQPTTLFDFRPRGDDSESTGDSDYVVSESNRNLFFRRDEGDFLVTQILQSVTEKGTKDVVKTISLNDWQEQGFDQDSVQADPLFVDPDHDDYRLKPESPAFRLGFVPTDMKRIGIQEQQ
jgi:parallel beta-helix repeat protein